MYIYYISKCIHTLMHKVTEYIDTLDWRSFICCAKIWRNISLSSESQNRKTRKTWKEKKGGTYHAHARVHLRNGYLANCEAAYFERSIQILGMSLDAARGKTREKSIRRRRRKKTRLYIHTRIYTHNNAISDKMSEIMLGRYIIR